MPDHHESSHLFTEGTKLGPNDHWSTAFGEMASHPQVFGMLFDAHRSGKADFSETSEHFRLEQYRQR